MTDDDLILARLVELAATGDDHEDFALRLALACQKILDADGTAVTIENNTPRRTTLCATDDVAARLEDLQDVTGEGPCRDAYRLNEPVVVTIEDAQTNRWPAFIPAALEAVGRLTTLSFPMRAGGLTYGTVSMYVASRRKLTESLKTAQLLVDAIAAALLRAPVDDLVGEDDPRSWRSIVYQATGMVIVQLGVPAADALAVLRAHAFATDQRLADVAGQVVSRRLDFKTLNPSD